MNEFNLPVHKPAACDDCINTPKVASWAVTATCVITYDGKLNQKEI